MQTTDTGSATPKWGSLPESVLNLIAKCLDTRNNVLRFRAVCNSFRASTPLPPKIPSPFTSLKLPVPMELNPIDGDHLLFSESTVYAIQSVNGTGTWLVKVEETSSGKLRALDLFSKFQVKHNLSGKLPTKSLKLLDYWVKEISKTYGFYLVSVGENKAIKYLNKTPHIFRKVVVSKCLDKIDDGFAVMMIFQNQLFVWRKGDENWSKVDCNIGRYTLIHDIVYHNGKFYAVNTTGHVVIVDSLSLDVTKIAAAVPYAYFDNYSTIFAKSCKDLYLLDSRYITYVDPCREYWASDVNVYKFDEELCQWEQMKNGSDDRAFFIGDDCSFSISTKDYSVCKANCVYLTYEEMISEFIAEHPGVEHFLGEKEAFSYRTLCAIILLSKQN